ncbi:MAG: polysaccharide biosynthesis protein [Fimbriimonadales bacterium]|nr:MAG: polysaccharide biosynthesis protein [Fimbriimonadales bacterium]
MTAREDGSKLHVLMLGPSLSVQGGVSSVERLILENQGPDVVIRMLPTTFQVPNALKFLAFFPVLIRLFWVLLTQRVDLVHIHFSVRGSMWRKAVCAELARLFKKPIVMHSHAGGLREYITSLPKWLQRWFCRVLRGADALIALSEGWRRYFVDELGLQEDRVHAMPNPIALPEWVPNRCGRKTVTLVFLGRMDENKGPVRILKAVSEFSDTMSKRVKIHMAGDGEVENVRRAAASLGLEQVTVVEDWVTPDRRDQILAQGDVFVLPSLFEGMPMSLLEAMAWGLPVVTTPVGGIPEVVTDGVEGFLVPPNDVGVLRDALGRLIADPDLRLRMGMAARESARRFDIKAYADSLTRLYRRAVQKRE